MASISLFLKTPNSTTVSKIAVRLRDGRGVNIVISSEFSVKVHNKDGKGGHWTKSKKVSSANPDSAYINNALEK